MNDQLQRAGAVLSAHADMISAFLGDQFAVSIIARHKTGPFHLLLGEDGEPALIKALGELQKVGTSLIDEHLGAVEGEDEQLTEVHGDPVPFAPGEETDEINITWADPEADAPATSRACPRCVGLLAADATECPVCGMATPL